VLFDSPPLTYWKTQLCLAGNRSGFCRRPLVLLGSSTINPSRLSTLARASFDLHCSLAQELDEPQSYGFRALITLILSVTESPNPLPSGSSNKVSDWVTIGTPIFAKIRWRRWGYFRQVWPKKLTCRARGCIFVSSDGAIGRNGVDWKFLQLFWMQLKQSKHWYHNCKLV